MGVSLEKNDIVKRTNLGDIKLGPNKYLKSCYRFLDTSKFLDSQEITQIIKELKEEGARVLIVSEAYGVDDPSNELYVMQKSDLPATAGHELTGIYGLEIRTLTAAINASILPKVYWYCKICRKGCPRAKNLCTNYNNEGRWRFN